MSGLTRDVLVALRSLWIDSSVAVAAIVTVALAVGGTSAVYAVVYFVLHRLPPVPAADRLVRMWEFHPGAQAPIPGAKISGPTYRAWSASSDTLQDLAAFGGRDYVISTGGGAQRVRG